MVIELVEIIGLFKLGYTKQAIGFLTKLVNKSIKQEGLIEIINKIYSSSQEFISHKNYKIALQLLQILEDLCVRANDFSRLCDIKNSMSFCYRSCELVKESLSKCLEALEIITQHLNLRSKLPALHLNACAIYREDFNDLANAQIHAKLAYFFAKECYDINDSNKRTLAISIYNYGFVSDELGDFKVAEKWYNDAYKFCKTQWEDKNLISIIQYKLRNLKTKMNLLNNKLAISGLSKFTSRRGTSENTRNNCIVRNTLKSQCSKKARKFTQEFSTPSAMKLTPFPNNSTENTANFKDQMSQEIGYYNKEISDNLLGNVFKVRRCPKKLKLQLRPKLIDFEHFNFNYNT